MYLQFTYIGILLLKKIKLQNTDFYLSKLPKENSLKFENWNYNYFILIILSILVQIKKLT